MAVKRATKRDQAHVRSEQGGSLLSQELAHTVQDANLLAFHRRLSDAEQRLAFIWAKRLQAAGSPSLRLLLVDAYICLDDALLA